MITQAHRQLSIETPLGQDKLLLQSASITEEIGRPFRAELDLASEDANLALDRIVGGNVTIRLQLPGRAEPRFFNGFINQFTRIGDESKNIRYRATMVPWLWFLTRSSDCRIYHRPRRSVPEIVTDVFRQQGFQQHVRLELAGRYDPWEYCVQYRETHFNFVSRLLEHEGISYFFEHGDGRHTLVLTDSPDAHHPFPGYDKVPLRHGKGVTGRQEGITDWSFSEELRPGRYTVNDFNYEKPGTPLLAEARSAAGESPHDFEIYDYPGEYGEHDDGIAYSKLRLEEVNAGQKVFHGAGNARGLAAGHTFTLTDPARREADRKYLITAASHHLRNDNYLAPGGGGGETYSCSFRAMDAARPFRPARTTPKPLIQGPQTAIVVGPAGQEIHTDKYRRVKVKFHWDRDGKADENSSCWVRVSQAGPAGRQWGALSVPRVGQEVIVEFLEGDPDQPIVTGQVYNAETKPPYRDDEHKWRTTFKTKSEGGHGFNELRFEDKRGQEQIFIHAERNQDVRVKADSLESVGHDRHLTVGHDQLETVSGDKHQEVKGDQYQKVGESLSLRVEQNVQEKIGMNLAVEAGAEIHVKAGMNLVLEAGASLTLKAGGQFVTISAAGVAISRSIKGGSPGHGSGASPVLPTAARPADDAAGSGQTAPARTPARPTPAARAPLATTLKEAAKDGTPFCRTCLDPQTIARVRALASPDILTRLKAVDPALARPSPTGQELWSLPQHSSEKEEDPEQPHVPEEEREREEEREWEERTEMEMD